MSQSMHNVSETNTRTTLNVSKAVWYVPSRRRRLMGRAHIVQEQYQGQRLPGKPPVRTFHRQAPYFHG